MIVKNHVRVVVKIWIIIDYNGHSNQTWDVDHKCNDALKTPQIPLIYFGCFHGTVKEIIRILNLSNLLPKMQNPLNLLIIQCFRGEKC